MPLDRKDIEKKDFPTARRGYAQDAVDAHLRALADEVEALKKKADAKPAQESMASGASEQVRAIVEAAESSAAGIKAQAELEARTLREDATAEGREHVARVSKASDALAERVQEMQAELKRLTDGLAAQLGRPEAAASAPPRRRPSRPSSRPSRTRTTTSPTTRSTRRRERSRASRRSRSEPEPEARGKRKRRRPTTTARARA